MDMAAPSTDKATESGTGWGVAFLLQTLGLGSAGAAASAPPSRI